MNSTCGNHVNGARHYRGSSQNKALATSAQRYLPKNRAVLISGTTSRIGVLRGSGETVPEYVGEDYIRKLW
jgi:hypothetical protein